MTRKKWAEGILIDNGYPEISFCSFHLFLHSWRAACILSTILCIFLAYALRTATSWGRRVSLLDDMVYCPKYLGAGFRAQLAQ